MIIPMETDVSAMQYPTVVHPELCTDGSLAYAAEIPALPGCMSHGATPDEARYNLEDAKREYLEALQERGLPIPVPPIDPVVSSVQWTTITAAPVPARDSIQAPTATIGSLSPQEVPSALSATLILP